MPKIEIDNYMQLPITEHEVACPVVSRFFADENGKITKVKWTAQKIIKSRVNGCDKVLYKLDKRTTRSIRNICIV